MNRISELYSAFRKNMQENITVMNSMYTPTVKNDWNDLFAGNLANLGKKYEANMKILKELDSILQKPLSGEDADAFYVEVMRLLEERIPDYRLVLPPAEKLISYYEKTDEIEKLIPVCIAYEYYLNDVKHKQFSISKNDYTMVDKVLALKDRYLEIQDESARTKIWMAYYIKIIIGMDNETVRPKEAFALREEMLELWNRPEIQKLEKENQQANRYVNRVKNNVTDALHTIDNEDSETKEVFCQLTKETYFSMLQETKSEYEIEPVLYASYLYVLYLNREETLDDIFDDLMDFYKYGAKKYQAETSISYDALEFFINITRVLFAWSKRGVDHEKTRKMVGYFVALAETRWKEVNKEKIPILNNLMKQLCNYIVTYKNSEVEVEKCIYQMIVQRNFFSYIHSAQISGITQILFEDAYQRAPELFANYSDMEYGELHEFINKAAVFHDIGTEDMIPFLYEKLYPMSKEEEEQSYLHPVFGARYVEQIEDMKKYREIILGHHKYYDGSGGYPKEYDNTQAFHRVIADMIFIADTLDSLADSFMQKGNNLSFEEIMQEFHNGSGTKYNPLLVEMIENSHELQQKLWKAVSGDKSEIIFSYYHDMENVLIHQDANEFMNEVSEKMQEIKVTGRYDEARPYLDRLFEYAAREQSDELLGKAYYYSMRLYILKEEFMNAINCGIEAIRYFERAEDYLFTGVTHNSIGICMQCQGNPEHGIGHFLQAAEYAEMCKDTRGGAIAYNNLAGIFREVCLYEKAIIYFEKAEALMEDNLPFKLVLYYNILYCYIKLNQRDKVLFYWNSAEEIEKKLEPVKDYSVFCSNLYRAYVDEYLGNTESLSECLERIKNEVSIFDDYQLYIEEINIYLDLLIKLGRIDEMTEQLDAYIAFCREKHISHYIFNSFLQKRIMYAYMQNDYKTSIDVSRYLGKVLEEQTYNQADVTLQMEGNYVKEMRRQRTRQEMISENRKLERRVEEEKSASEAKTAFLSSMTHEIRTPIHAVIGLDEMILREANEEHILQYARDIKTAGKKLLGIVNDILDFSKMEAGKIEIIPERYKLSDLLSELEQAFHESAKDKGLDFTVTCSPEIPNVLMGDDTRIRQIMKNLLSNGVKFTERGFVELSVQLSNYATNGAVTLVFDVKDTGIGLKRKEIAKLMKPFGRMDEDRNRSIEGAGLGMSIVNQLVKMMNGSLRVKSEYGKGSEFIVELTQRVIEETPIGELSFNKPKNEGKEKTLYAPEAKILVIDDNAVNLKVITSLLKRTGIRITTARSGKEGLQIASSMRFDLILLDHRMPEMDGLETLQHLKEAEGPNQHTNVIALTANVMSGALEFYRKNGFLDFLPKPVDYRLLEEKIEYYLPKEILKNKTET